MDHRWVGLLREGEYAGAEWVSFVFIDVRKWPGPSRRMYADALKGNFVWGLGSSWCGGLVYGWFRMRTWENCVDLMYRLQTLKSAWLKVSRLE